MRTNPAGEGSYSNVYQVQRHADGMEYALKRVDVDKLGEKEQENAINEVRLLASLRSPFVVGYKEAFVDRPSNSLW